MTIKSVDARCLNCKTEVKAGQETCRCGDRVGRPFDIINEQGSGKSERHTPLVTGPTKIIVVKPTGVTLTPEQDDALTAIRDWFATPFAETFYLTGPAGTGKTTLAKHVGQALGVHPSFGAYTGKAAHVLRRKGVPATTIHSAIYVPDPMRARAELRAVLDEIADVKLSGVYDTEPGAQERMRKLEAEATHLEANLRKPAFSLDPDCEWASADLIVLDEVSMVNERMATDILSLGVPVLVLGDPAQLPPIDGGGAFTKRAPDFALTEVHRQALESPVLRLATDIREGRGWPVEKVNLAKAMEADQVIVWKNSTRWNLIEKMREKLGRPKGTPVSGDKVMCLVNNKDLGILNGQQYTVIACVPSALGPSLTLQDDDGKISTIDAYPGGFQGLDAERDMRENSSAWRGRRGAFTFANAITCHKAQGSEWSNVYVVDQTHQMWKSTAEDKKRWVYTACSRASERVTIASTSA